MKTIDSVTTRILGQDQTGQPSRISVEMAGHPDALVQIVRTCEAIANSRAELNETGKLSAPEMVGLLWLAYQADPKLGNGEGDAETFARWVEEEMVGYLNGPSYG